MQSLTVLATSDTLATSRAYLNDNFTTVLSHSSGTSFPATNLVVGMTCYRTDTRATSQLVSVGPSVWVTVFDNSKTYLSMEGGDARYPKNSAGITTMLGYTPVNKGGDTMAGQLFVQGAGGTDPGTVAVRADAGYLASLNFARRDNTARFTVVKNTTAEAGSNAGSNLEIRRFSDAGAQLGVPVTITRSTGQVTFEVAPYVGSDKMWHNGNDGSGSGLDADLIDGLDSAVLLQTNAEKQTTKRIYPATTTLVDGATITWDLSLGPIATVTLGGNRTLAFSGTIRAGTYVLKVKQDATGSRTLTWPATVKTPGATPIVLTTTANAEDVITFMSDGTNMYAVPAYNFG